MSAQEVVFKDIFEGADRIEILGKLPSILWLYLEAARSLVLNVSTASGEHGASVANALKMLSIVEAASRFVSNEELSQCLEAHSRMLEALSAGRLASGDFLDSFKSEFPKLERMAGPRPDPSADPDLERRLLAQALEKGEKIKAGRSADLVVSVDLLDDIRDCLANASETQGISSIMVIDNAGTLIVHVGDRVDLDAISLAAVSAANFAATERIARLIGERDFVLLFYKGHNESFHFSRLGDEFIIVTIFDNALSLGLLRLKIAELSQLLDQKLPRRQG